MNKTVHTTLIKKGQTVCGNLRQIPKTETKTRLLQQGVELYSIYA